MSDAQERLTSYRAKRHFSLTAEPPGSARPPEVGAGAAGAAGATESSGAGGGVAGG